MPTRVLTSDEVERVLDRGALIDALARVHRGISAGAVLQPPPHPLRDTRPGGRGDERDGLAVVPMLAYDIDEGVFAMKALADAPGNRSRGMPAQRSTVAVFDAATGECTGMIDGRALTRIRTAAVTALATAWLAEPGAATLSILGAGPLAIEHARTLTEARSSTGRPYERVVLWSRSTRRARDACEELARHGVVAETEASAEEAVRAGDVVCTLTPAEQPYLHGGWLRPGSLVNAVGSPPRPRFAELRPEVFARAAVTVVDTREVALGESGNVRGALAAGSLDPARLVELGEVLTGGAAVAADDVRVFSSVGIGAQDLAASVLALGVAEQRGIGTVVDARAAHAAS